MPFSNFATMSHDNLEQDLSVKILTTEYDFYAALIQKDEVLLQIHYHRVEGKMNILDGKLGGIINDSSLPKIRKIQICSELLKQSLSKDGLQLSGKNQESIKHLWNEKINPFEKRMTQLVNI